jgi:Spy/CpxP family protein refolding chaperone
MNTGTRAALRRLGLALAVGGIAAGGALAAADLPDSVSGADDADAVQGMPPGGDSDTGGGHDPGGYGEHGGFGRDHGGPGPGFGADRADGWHHGAGMGRRGFDRSDRSPLMDRGFFAALRQLELTPVQREQMRTIVFNAREAVRMERANEQQSGAAERRRDDLAALSNPGDPNYAQALQQLKSRAAERVQQAIARASETEQKLYGVLTTEQKAQLPKVLSEQRARHEQRTQDLRRRHEGAAPGASPNAPPPPAQ